MAYLDRIRYRRLIGAAVIVALVGVVASCVPAPPPGRGSNPGTTPPTPGGGNVPSPASSPCPLGQAGSGGTSSTSVTRNLGGGATGPGQEALEGSDLVQAVTNAATEATARGANVTVVSQDETGRPVFSVVEPASAGSVAFQAAVSPLHDVVAVEADKVIRKSADVSDTAVPDPLRPNQWDFDSLKFETAWAFGKGEGVKVAVVDTGVDVTHPEFGGRVTCGISFLSPQAGVLGGGGTDPDGHGTHVAGTIAAAANNGLGIHGVAPLAQIIPVRVLSDNGEGWTSDVARGVTWAVDNGAQVINVSLGSESNDTSMAVSVRYAVNHGVLVVAAAGNEGQSGNKGSYPAAYPDAIAVASSQSSGAISPFSTNASYVDVTAPGSAIVSTTPVSLPPGARLAPNYDTLSGTSMAAPHVSGLAALIIGSRPGVSAAAVRWLIESTAIDRGVEGRDDVWGLGIIDPVGAVTKSLP